MILLGYTVVAVAASLAIVWLSQKLSYLDEERDYL